IRIQPIAQADVLAAIAWAIAVAPRPLRVLNLVGPETLTYAELLHRACHQLGKRPRVLGIPRAAAWLSACLVGALVPALGRNPSVYDPLFHAHLADPPEALAPPPWALPPVHTPLPQVTAARP